jgi:hypothetical protein
VIAQEIVDDLEAALEQFRLIAGTWERSCGGACICAEGVKNKNSTELWKTPRL